MCAVSRMGDNADKARTVGNLIYLEMECDGMVRLVKVVINSLSLGWQSVPPLTHIQLTLQYG
jgi:hypothetical protein